jgi:hypothetical protein
LSLNYVSSHVLEARGESSSHEVLLCLLLCLSLAYLRPWHRGAWFERSSVEWAREEAQEWLMLQMR